MHRIDETGIGPGETIPAGYRITVWSWEDDRDRRWSMTISGLSAREAAWLAEIARLLSASPRLGDGRFGNMTAADQAGISGFAGAIAEIARQRHQWLADGRSDAEILCEARQAIESLGLCSEWFHTRMTEGVKVEYTPEPIRLEDVTGEFVGEAASGHAAMSRAARSRPDPGRGEEAWGGGIGKG